MPEIKLETIAKAALPFVFSNKQKPPTRLNFTRDVYRTLEELKKCDRSGKPMEVGLILQDFRRVASIADSVDLTDFLSQTDARISSRKNDVGSMQTHLSFDKQKLEALAGVKQPADSTQVPTTTNYTDRVGIKPKPEFKSLRDQEQALAEHLDRLMQEEYQRQQNSGGYRRY